MATIETEALPPLYAGWVRTLLGGDVPRESKATCESCAMCARPGEAPDPQTPYFDPAVKCCTYAPELPNYLVGGILADGDPATAEGREAILRRIEDGDGVTPLGIGPSATASLIYQHLGEAFGRAPSLACPYLLKESGRCGVWLHRNSVCATWFCKHVRGAVGQSFWRGSLARFLGAVERDLARWCVLQLEPDIETLRHLATSPAWTSGQPPLSADAIEHRVDAADYAKAWGAWRSREAEYFQRCAKLVDGLALDEVLAIAGPEAAAVARLTQDAYASLVTPRTPARLHPGRMQVVRIGAETTRISTYSEYDPVDVPNVVMAMMPGFDGRPTDVVVEDLVAKTGVRLEDSLLQKLADFDLLVPPAA